MYIVDDGAHPSSACRYTRNIHDPETLKNFIWMEGGSTRVIKINKFTAAPKNQHCPNNVHIYLLLNGVNISSNITAENPVFHKLVGRLDDPSLAVPLGEPARHRSNLKIS
jgi:hypothetical protein